jgi:hypothetical protein
MQQEQCKKKPFPPPLPVNRVGAIADLEQQKLRSQINAAHAVEIETTDGVEEPVEQGNLLMQVHEVVKGHIMHGYEIVRVDKTEHALIYFYANFQILIHMYDSKKLYGDGSRFVSWWKREVAPGQRGTLIADTKKWLTNRAAKRAKASKAA